MSKKLPKSLTTVTTFSKIIALILFALLPIWGFMLGMQYQRQLDSPHLNETVQQQ